MDSFSWFIVIILTLISFNHAHARYTRASLIRYLQDDNKSAADIATIMKAYKED